MAVTAKLKRQDTGAEITGLVYTDMISGSVNASDYAGAFVAIEGANSVVAIELGITDVGAFTGGDALTYQNYYHKISPATSWTQFTGLSSNSSDTDNIDIYNSSSISKVFDIGISPNTNNIGTLDGNGTFTAYYTYV